MSWSKKGIYKDVATAQAAIEADGHLPSEVKSYISRGLANIPDQSQPVSIDGHGHVCDGPGSYATTSCSLNVQPLVFTDK